MKKQNEEQWLNEIDVCVTEVDKVNNKLLNFVELNQRAKQQELVQSYKQEIKLEKQILGQKLGAVLKEGELTGKKKMQNCQS